MRKKVLCAVLALALLCACGCTKIEKPVSLDGDYIEICESVLGKTEEEIHEAYGQPSSFLSGFRGDIYRTPDNRLLILYYGNDDLTVRQVKLSEPVDDANVIRVSYTEDLRLADGCLNAQTIAETLHLSSVLHLPVFRFDSAEELVQFMDSYGDVLSVDEGHDCAPSLRDAASAYDEDFFKENCLLAAYMTAGSGSFRYGAEVVHTDAGEVCVYVNRTNDPKVYTDDMAGWMILAPQKRSELRKCEIYDALYGGA